MKGNDHHVETMETAYFKGLQQNTKLQLKINSYKSQQLAVTSANRYSGSAVQHTLS